ncbi:unnamed protein product [Caenorhabditis auriculariae]|uniref:Uncharacterized protein n=1 Tax=Caenorhabditis auriculariae TaxID=2777116 RepID=A0A8S1H0C7_9PELO|nr:unnamed protein product [Caenorhabditis auriculariae]
MGTADDDRPVGIVAIVSKYYQRMCAAVPAIHQAYATKRFAYVEWLGGESVLPRSACSFFLSCVGDGPPREKGPPRLAACLTDFAAVGRLSTLASAGPSFQSHLSYLQSLISCYQQQLNLNTNNVEQGWRSTNTEESSELHSCPGCVQLRK